LIAKTPQRSRARRAYSHSRFHLLLLPQLKVQAHLFVKVRLKLPSMQQHLYAS
jgi:hypothetical protein